MKSTMLNRITRTLLLTFLLAFAAQFAVAAKEKPMTPEVAAKKENFRKQNEQRVTDKQRKTAAENLKAERLKVYKAKQLMKKSNTEQTTPKPIE